MAEGLEFPEGPIAMGDGSVILTEIHRGTLTRVWPNGRTEVVAQTGGGPNGAAIGPDGAVHVTNNGGASPDGHQARQAAGARSLTVSGLSGIEILPTVYNSEMSGFSGI